MHHYVGIDLKEVYQYISILVCHNIRLLLYWHISTLIILLTVI